MDPEAFLIPIMQGRHPEEHHNPYSAHHVQSLEEYVRVYEITGNQECRAENNERRKLSTHESLGLFSSNDST